MFSLIPERFSSATIHFSDSFILLLRTLRFFFFARQQLTHLKLGHGRLSRPRSHLFISVPIPCTKSDCVGGGGGAGALRVHSWAPFGFVCKGSDHTLRPLDRQLFQVEDLTAHSQ